MTAQTELHDRCTIAMRTAHGLPYIMTFEQAGVAVAAYCVSLLGTKPSTMTLRIPDSVSDAYKSRWRNEH